jgi:hypothetical protein
LPTVAVGVVPLILAVAVGVVLLTLAAAVRGVLLIPALAVGVVPLILAVAVRVVPLTLAVAVGAVLLIPALAVGLVSLIPWACCWYCSSYCQLYFRLIVAESSFGFSALTKFSICALSVVGSAQRRCGVIPVVVNSDKNCNSKKIEKLLLYVKSHGMLNGLLLIGISSTKKAFI